MKVIRNTEAKFPMLYTLFTVMWMCSLFLLLPSCASQTASNSDTIENQPDSASASGTTESAASNESTEDTVPQSNPVVKNELDSETSAQQPRPTDTTESIDLAAIGESCKQQPFVQYEKQAREHIQHGWEATQAQRFGVGFRDGDEYEKWKKVHNTLFTTVSDTCVQLSECVKQNPSDKGEKCTAQAKRFEQWQTLAKQFVDKVKIVESSQPPMLCSITPSADDPSQCYALVADQIDQACQSELCNETASCFRGVGFLDDAINQAKLACGFVHQELSECRGYVEETGRRKAEFQQCLDKYNRLQVEVLPVI
jgi:hypothetical protein